MTRADGLAALLGFQDDLEALAAFLEHWAGRIEATRRRALEVPAKGQRVVPLEPVTAERLACRISAVGEGLAALIGEHNRVDGRAVLPVAIRREGLQRLAAIHGSVVKFQEWAMRHTAPDDPDPLRAEPPLLPDLTHLLGTLAEARLDLENAQIAPRTSGRVHAELVLLDMFQRLAGRRGVTKKAIPSDTRRGEAHIREGAALDFCAAVIERLVVGMERQTT